MQAMESASSRDPPGFVWLQRFLPTAILVNTFANFFTLTITLGPYGPANRFWLSFEVFISLAWLLFLVSLTLCIVYV